MWIPKEEAEIINVVTSNSLEETSIFDTKKEIPAKGIETAKTETSLAKSIGGVLIYGFNEDENGFPTVLSPISLKGERERIEAIISKTEPFKNMIDNTKKTKNIAFRVIEEANQKIVR